MTRHGEILGLVVACCFATACGAKQNAAKTTTGQTEVGDLQLVIPNGLIVKVPDNAPLNEKELANRILEIDANMDELISKMPEGERQTRRDIVTELRCEAIWELHEAMDLEKVTSAPANLEETNELIDKANQYMQPDVQALWSRTRISVESEERFVIKYMSALNRRLDSQEWEEYVYNTDLRKGVYVFILIQAQRPNERYKEVRLRVFDDIFEHKLTAIAVQQ